MDRMLQLAETNHSNLASMSNNLDSMTATLGRIDRRLETESNRRASFQTGPQGAFNPSYPQYSSIQGSSRSNERSARGEGSSKRRRH